MLLQMVLFHPFLWLSNNPLYISITSSLSIHLQWIFRLLPCLGYCKWHHWSTVPLWAILSTPTFSKWLKSLPIPPVSSGFYVKPPPGSWLLLLHFTGILNISLFKIEFITCFSSLFFYLSENWSCVIPATILFLLNTEGLPHFKGFL